ncbi:MAG: hypothetical protein HGA87_00455 [Desulfobulbaceae bacterium]|nr:hypothetical protein [Desulfobulbaceae bacterium]
MDKVFHFFAGFVIALGVGAGSGDVTTAASTAASVGAAKEDYDGRHPATHTRDFYDYAATAAGGVVGSLLITTKHDNNDTLTTDGRKPSEVQAAGQNP